MNIPHCVPAELWRAAREKLRHDQATLDHLAVCADCSTLWETISRFPGALTGRLDNAPSGWIESAIAIAGTKSGASKFAKLMGKLQFDSWITASPVVLRGTSGGPSRRLSWQADTLSIDLRAEDTTSGWNFTAQVLDGGHPRGGVEIRSGSLKVRTDDAGLATWTAARPPRILHTTLDTRSVQLGPLSWQLPKRS